jgi:DNA-directed RNA polymerase specialized sigma24 family protein
MRLRRYTTPIPRSLAPYLVRALRIHRLALRRDERRRADGERDSEISDTDPAAPLTSALSEDTLRASAGPDGERTPPSTALERLASMVEEGLSREEELLLSWVSRYVPQSDVAQWLGISHGAARNRVMRLRARLKEVALQHVATFTGRERDELREFFRRTSAAPRGRTGDRTERGATRPTEATPPRRARNDREDL